GGRANYEDGGLGITRRSGGFKTVQVEGVQVTEGEGIRALLDLHAIIDTTTHKPRTLERFGASGPDDEQRILAVAQTCLQVFEAMIAEQTATNVRMIEVAEPKLDEWLGGTGQ